MQNVEYILSFLLSFLETISQLVLSVLRGRARTNLQTDRQMVLSFTFICWTAVVIHKCFEFSELQFSVYFTEETDNQRLF